MPESARATRSRRGTTIPKLGERILPTEHPGRLSPLQVAQFLLALGRGNQFADLYDEGQSEVERVRARLLLKNLLHPEGLGETFQVFVQHKGVEAPRLAGLQPL